MNTNENPDQWAIGDGVSVVEYHGRGREVYRGKIVHITSTQIVVEHQFGGSSARFRRADGLQIDAVYGHRKIVRLSPPAPVQP